MERKRHTPSEIAGGLIWNCVVENLRMSVDGLDNLYTVNNHFHKGGRVLLSHSHPGSFDPGIVLRPVIDYLDYKKLGYPASSKLLDNRMFYYGWVIDYLKSEGLIDEVWAIVQDNDPAKLRQKLKERASRIKMLNRQDIKNIPQTVYKYIFGDSNNSEPDQDIAESISSVGLNKEALEAAVTFFRDTPSALICIADESTRNIQTNLFRKNRGLKRSKNMAPYIFGSVPDNTLLLAVALEGTENMLQKGQKSPPNLLARSKAHIGVPRTFEEVVKVAVYLNKQCKGYMRCLADAMKLEQVVLLPPTYWGYYQPMIEQIMTTTGIPNPGLALDTIRNRQTDSREILRYRNFFSKLRGMIVI